MKLLFLELLFSLLKKFEHSYEKLVLLGQTFPFLTFFVFILIMSAAFVYLCLLTNIIYINRNNSNVFFPYWASHSFMWIQSMFSLAFYNSN